MKHETFVSFKHHEHEHEPLIEINCLATNKVHDPLK